MGPSKIHPKACDSHQDSIIERACVRTSQNALLQIAGTDSSTSGGRGGGWRERCTLSVWPTRVCRGIAVRVSHSLAVLSYDDVNTWYSECSDRAIEVIQSEWELKVLTPCMDDQSGECMPSIELQHSKLQSVTQSPQHAQPERAPSLYSKPFAHA